MEQILLSQVRDHKTVAITVTAVIYFWSIVYRTSYLSFLSGMATTVLIEALLFWIYLGTRVQTQTGKKMTLELAKIEARKIFGDDVGVNYHEVELKLKKKKYYENNRSKFSFEAFKPKLNVEVPVEPQPILKEEVATPTESTIAQSPAFSHKQINELLKERELNREKVDTPTVDKDLKKVGLEDKMMISKIGHKAFVEQMNSFLNILACIGLSEKNYAKSLSNFDPKHIPADDSSNVKGEAITLNLFKIRSLNEKDSSFLVAKFGKEFTDSKYLHLPDWKKMKQTINVLGQFHGNCSTVVNKTSVPNINKLINEYEEKYQERKKEKKKLTKEYEEIYLNYTKLKTEYETLNKTLEATLSEYQAKFKKKRDDEVVLKHEMKARLVKSQLDTLANKVSSASDKLQESIRAMAAENNKIANFTHQWDEKKEAVCYEILKHIIIILAENNAGAEKSFELLFQTRRSAAGSKNEIKDPSPAAVPGEELKLEYEREISDKIKDVEIKLRQPSSPLVDSATKPKPRQKRSSFKGKELDENKVARMVEDFKDTIEEFMQVYNDDLGTYNEEFKKSKDIAVMLKQLADYEDEYTKERDKLVSFNFLNLKVDTLAKFWKMIQNNVYLVNRFNTHLHEKLISLEKSYEEFIKNQEKDLKACDVIIQNAIKRASAFTKNMEKELLKKEMHKDKKDFFSKLFNNDEKEPEIDDVAIVTEKCLFTEEIEKGLAQINTLIVRSQKKATGLKKDMLIAYLKCFTGQKDLSLSLTNEIEKLDPLIKHPQEETKEDGSKNEGSNDAKDNSGEATPLNQNNIESRPEEQKESDIVLNQASRETDLEKPGDPLGPDGLALLNRMFKVFAMEWSKSGYFKEKISKSLFRAFNKKPSKFVRRIKIKDLIFEPKFPDLRSVTPLPCDSFEFLYDAEMAYQGNILIEIETRLEPQPVISFFAGDQPIPLTAKVLIKSLNAKVRICWVPSDYGRSWYSFVGQPILNMSIEPKIGVSQFDITAIPQATTIISDLIMKKIKKMTFPYRKELDLPMAFRDPKIVPPPE